MEPAEAVDAAVEAHLAQPARRGGRTGKRHRVGGSREGEGSQSDTSCRKNSLEHPTSPFSCLGRDPSVERPSWSSSVAGWSQFAAGDFGRPGSSLFGSIQVYVCNALVTW